MMAILAFLQNFSEIREMTLNDLRGQKILFDLGFREVNKHYQPCKWRPITQKEVIHTRLRRAC